MSEASERLREIIEDGAISIWPDITDNIKTVLDELESLKADNLEWLRIVRGYLDCDEDSPEEADWHWQMHEMRRGRSEINTPVPVVEQLRAERDRAFIMLTKLRRQLGELYYSPALTMRDGNSDLRLIVGMMLKESEPLTDGKGGL